MIRTIDIDINAASPEMPLRPLTAFVSSPSSVRVRNVPRQIGEWRITSVYITANYPDNASRSASCVLAGGVWTGTLVGSAAVGSSVNGFTITADGKNENGDAVTGYVLGKGDVIIMATDGTVTVGETTYYIHLLDSEPATPHKGDLCRISNTWKIYTGSQWEAFGGGGGDMSHSEFADLPAADMDPEETGITEICNMLNSIKTKLRGTSAALILALSAFTAFGGVTTTKLVNLKGASNVVTAVSFTAAEIGAEPTIADLATIRSGAAAGATALQAESDPLSLHTADTNDFASGILSQSGRDCAGKIAALSNNVTKVLKVTQGDAAWEYNGTEEVQIDLAQGGGGTDGAAVTNIVASIFPSNRVFGVDGGLLTAYDVSADGARTNEIWREARGYAMTNGVERGGLIGVVNPAIDGTITTITIGDETMAAAGVSVDLPSAWDAEARDFAVYVFNSSSTAAPLRLPTNATIYGYATSATNALKANAATALYFTEISRNTFLLGRAELTKVQEAAQ